MSARLPDEDWESHVGPLERGGAAGTVRILRADRAAILESERKWRDAFTGKWAAGRYDEDGALENPDGWMLIEAGRYDELERAEASERDLLAACEAFVEAYRWPIYANEGDKERRDKMTHAQVMADRAIANAHRQDAAQAAGGGGL